MKYYFDGYTIQDNPSLIGGGFTVFEEDKLIYTEQILKKGFTNNEAELHGLEWCLNNLDNVVVSTDSKNTIRWATKGKSKSRPDLNERLKIVKSKMDSILLIWEPREKNKAGWYNESHFNG